jgi:hypothetical protein
MSGDELVYKRRDDALVGHANGSHDNGDDISAGYEPFSEEQRDVLCRVIAMMGSDISDELRMDVADNRDMIAALRERLAAGEASLKLMTSLFAGTGGVVVTVTQSTKLVEIPAVEIPATTGGSIDGGTFSVGAGGSPKNRAQASHDRGCATKVP